MAQLVELDQADLETLQRIQTAAIIEVSQLRRVVEMAMASPPRLLQPEVVGETVAVKRLARLLTALEAAETVLAGAEPVELDQATMENQQLRLNL